MTTGLILIAAILVLGGVIASVGDRIGTKVGKARLSLFKLRPKNTAVLVTLLTGSLISGSTLAILFAASEQLRTGVFKLETIQKSLKNARQEIEQTKTEKNQVEAEKSRVEDELAQAKSQQATAQKRLDSTNQALQLVLAKLAEAFAKQARTEGQLNQTQGQLSRTETQLSQTQGQLNQTQGQLSQTQGELDRTGQQLKTVSGQAQELRSEIERLQAEGKDLIAQRNQVKAQITELKKQLDRRDEKIADRDRTIDRKDEKIAVQDQAIAQRDQKIAVQDQTISQREQEINLRDQRIATRDQVIAQQETRFKQLQQQLTEREQLLAQRDTKLSEQNRKLLDQDKKLSEREQKLNLLQKEVASLEQDYQQLFQGNVTVRRGQVLSAGVFRIVEPTAARQAVDRLLLQANRVALERTRPGNKTNKEQVIAIKPSEVNKLIEQIDDGKDYVVRIISAGNYVAGGESPVQVVVDVAPNRVVFQAGDVVASTSADPATMTEDQLREKLDLLIAASLFRVRRAGIVADKIQIGDDRIETLTHFLEQLKQSKKLIDVQVVTSDITYTAGPVKMDLIAIQGGQVIFRTQAAS
ncbi:DUF3084 domain-containing protein [Argonema antarcticum]|uniref:DUF3084 domain-containing protein n=1 Tax=Argonema antarcticum TaxID=2942763 RepID=UPI00201276E9|nr:DUF3084 domain-containing protein [Argonema antarcticum]MCL1470868.1 DUF3084 domain-containing protein [Argonema antarcticum A004/B2]